jgi:ribosome-associated protein
MPAETRLRAGKHLMIPRAELIYHATRSGGPGGQHVNTSSTRIELWWNLETSTAPTETQRRLLRDRLATRLDGEGWLRLTESGSRSQFRNREAATERLAHLLARAVLPRKPRQPTRVPRTEKRKRVETKRRRGEIKQLRARVRDAE